MSLAWVADQIGAATAAKPAPAAPRFNPHPPGQIWPGSATEATLEFLRANPGRLWRLHEIMLAIKRSRSATGWALCFLRSQRLIDTVPDGTRNPRYFRYRVAQTGRAA